MFFLQMIHILYDVKAYHGFLAGRRGRVAIEIGPHVGKSTGFIARGFGKVIAVDKAVQSKEAFGKSGLKNVSFVQGDVREFDTLRKVLAKTKSCDMLAVDMGGGRFPDTVFKVWAVWSGVFKPKTSVIRNRGLAEFIQKARIEDKGLIKEFEDSGWLDECGRKLPAQLKEGLDEMEYWRKS